MKVLTKVIYVVKWKQRVDRSFRSIAIVFRYFALRKPGNFKKSDKKWGHTCFADTKEDNTSFPEGFIKNLLGPKWFIKNRLRFQSCIYDFLLLFYLGALRKPRARPVYLAVYCYFVSRWNNVNKEESRKTLPMILKNTEKGKNIPKSERTGSVSIYLLFTSDRYSKKVGLSFYYSNTQIIIYNQNTKFYNYT